MAKLIHADYEPHEPSIDGTDFRWSRCLSVDEMQAAVSSRPKLPVLLSKSWEPWIPGSLWLATRFEVCLNGDISVLTLQHEAWSLKTYLGFLESSGLSWDDFPARRLHQPTVAFRKALIGLRDAGQLSGSTIASRMAVVVRFYKWALQVSLLKTSSQIIQPKPKALFKPDERGVIHAFTVESTDLHIPSRRKHPRPALEGGLAPVNSQIRERILQLASKHCSEEFALMLTLGFATGMRLRSILDLKIETLEQAVPGEVPGIHYLLIGPKHNVSTKFSIDGRALIPTALLDRLKIYSTSLRRLRRASKAGDSYQDLLFLNRFGKRYNRRELDRSPSVNIDMIRLRRIAERHDLDLRGFYFHCTRATFATSIVVSGLRTPGISMEAILCRLSDLLMHKDEATSLRYVRYVEGTNLIAHHEKSYASWLFGETPDEDA